MQILQFLGAVPLFQELSSKHLQDMGKAVDADAFEARDFSLDLAIFEARNGPFDHGIGATARLVLIEFDVFDTLFFNLIQWLTN